MQANKLKTLKITNNLNNYPIQSMALAKSIQETKQKKHKFIEKGLAKVNNLKRGHDRPPQERVTEKQALQKEGKTQAGGQV